MKKINWIILPIALITGQLSAAPITLTPPDTLVLNGVSINTGIFTLTSAQTIDPLASLAAGSLVATDLITEDVVIDPAIIGSGTQHTLFNAPDIFLPLNLLAYNFQIVDPEVAPGTLSTVFGFTFSALTNFDISLPTTTGNLTTGPSILFEFIDINGQSVFSNTGFDSINVTPDPTAALNFDIFGDGSFYFVFQDTPGTPFSVQEHGRVGGFTPPPPAVPLPATIWLMSSALVFGLLGLRGKAKQ